MNSPQDSPKDASGSKALSRLAKPAPPCTLVVFGANGDLTSRLLMPALYNLAGAGLLDDGFSVLGVDRADGGDQDFRDRQKDAMERFTPAAGGEFAEKSLNTDWWSWLATRLHYAQGDFTQASIFDNLHRLLRDGNAVFYLAVADRFFGTIIDRLDGAGLTAQGNGRFHRVVIEKPFGHDLRSAKELNASILSQLNEDQIYRIDHFLGKRMSECTTQIAIQFKQEPFGLFRDVPVDKLMPNVLVWQLQPDEGVTIGFSAKRPGQLVDLASVQLGFSYKKFFDLAPATGYETLIYDVMIGDPMLFNRADNIEAGWAFVQTILDSVTDGNVDVHANPVGSDGPAEADALLSADGRAWMDLA